MKVNSKSRTRKILLATWLIPIVVASPYVFSKSISFTIQSELGSISREICNDRFNEIDIFMYGDDQEKAGSFRRGYFLFLFCSIYVVPSVLILVTCIKIAVSLLQPIIVENSSMGRKDSSRKNEENKRKVKVTACKSFWKNMTWNPLNIFYKSTIYLTKKETL